MKRRITLTLILTALVCLLLSVSAGAATVDSGECGAEGDNVTWVLVGAKLTISGKGAMQNYSHPSNAPWYRLRHEIYWVVIEDGVTTIGKHQPEPSSQPRRTTLNIATTTKRRISTTMI